MDDHETSPQAQDNVVPTDQGPLDYRAFQAAVDMTRMAMAIADPNKPDCPLVYVNAAFTEMTGYTPADVVGRNCRFMQGPGTDPATVARIRQAVAARQPFDEEIYNYRKDGAGFWNALYISPVFNEGGKLIYHFASQIDVSHRKEAERRQAQRAESMGALASGVAHEFNNLMTVVMSSAEQAALRAADQRQSDLLTRAIWAAQRAGQLATELLTLTRPRSIADHAVDLNDVVREFEPTLAQLAGPRTRHRLELAPEPVLARLDAGRLRLVLLNLARNAAEAMTEGGELVIGTRALSPTEASTALNGQAAVELFVSDTGKGMVPQVLARATELFFTTKDTSRGTGLGLFLALEFVDHSGGKLSFDSEPGQGTTARMAFPVMG